MKKGLLILLLILSFNLSSCRIDLGKKETTNAEREAKEGRISMVRYPAALDFGRGI